MTGLRRFGQLIRVRPESVEAYERLHAEPWPAVLAAIRRANIRNYSIYRHDGLLFAYLEYVGNDYAGDMAAMAADPDVQAWWTLTDAMQEPFPERAAGTASAATTSTVGGSSTTSGSVAGTRVGVSSSDSILAVGVDSSIAAGQRRGTLLSQPQLVSGLCVAAEANDAARDFPGDAVRAKIPDEWGPGKPAAKGNGWRWQPDKNGKNYVRVDPGDPASPQPLQQVDHVHVTSGGRQVADHLPLSDWLNWSSWSTP